MVLLDFLCLKTYKKTPHLCFYVNYSQRYHNLQIFLSRGACDWFFWKRKSPLLRVRLGLFSSKKLFCLFHSASRRESEKSYKDGRHGTKIFSGNSVKWNTELWNLYDSCNSDQNEWRVQSDHNTEIYHFLQEFQFASRASQYCQPSWFSSDLFWLFDSQAKKSPLPRTSSSSGRDESHAPSVSAILDFWNLWVSWEKSSLA